MHGPQWMPQNSIMTTRPFRSSDFSSVPTIVLPRRTPSDLMSILNSAAPAKAGARPATRQASKQKRESGMRDFSSEDRGGGRRIMNFLENKGFNAQGQACNVGYRLDDGFAREFQQEVTKIRLVSRDAEPSGGAG